MTAWTMTARGREGRMREQAGIVVCPGVQDGGHHFAGSG